MSSSTPQHRAGVPGVLALLVAGILTAAIVLRAWFTPAPPRAASATPLLDAVVSTGGVAGDLSAILEDPALDPIAVRRAVDAVQAQLARGAFPGAAVVVGRGPEIATARGLGRVAWNEAPVDPARTRYDLASLTKVVATTSAVMLLVEDGRMDLDAPVSRYLPAFRGTNKSRVTVRHLLTHTSGLPAGGSATSLGRILATRLVSRPGARVRYSDLGMIVLWEAAERAAGEPLPALLERRVWTPLGMHATGFSPGAGCTACAPTSGGARGRGIVHDPIARRLGGVAGNAGLFSTAQDLGRFAAMLASGGALDSVRVFQAETVRAFLAPQAGGRALGWDTQDGAVLHTGYTGTSLWIDPRRGAWAVLLTNATYQPKVARARSRVGRVRHEVHQWVAVAAAE